MDGGGSCGVVGEDVLVLIAVAVVPLPGVLSVMFFEVGGGVAGAVSPFAGLGAWGVGVVPGCRLWVSSGEAVPFFCEGVGALVVGAVAGGDPLPLRDVGGDAGVRGSDEGGVVGVVPVALAGDLSVAGILHAGGVAVLDKFVEVVEEVEEGSLGRGGVVCGGVGRHIWEMLRRGGCFRRVGLGTGS